MNWPQVALGEIAQVVGGSTPSRSETEYWGPGYYWTTPSDLPMPGDGILDLHETKETITEKGLNASSANLLPIGTVLYSTRATIGKLAIAQVPVATNQGFNNFIVGPTIINRYLAYALQHYTRDIEYLAGSTTFKEVSRSKLRSFKIPLPPLSEQRRIVDILRKADAIRSQSYGADTKADQILPALFLRMFGDPVTNPMGWPLKPLGNVIERVEAGWSARSEARERKPNEYGVLKVSAVTSGTFLPHENKAVPVIQDGRKLITPKRGDLLFSRANTRELVAATCLVEDDYPLLFLPDKLWRLIPCENEATTAYLRELMAMDAIRDKFRVSSSGSSGSMLNVSQDAVLRTIVPIADYEVQKLFTALAWKIIRFQNDCRHAVHNIDRVWITLFQHAFSGQLTAKWRDAHTQELLTEMQEQARLLNLPIPQDLGVLA